MTKQELNKLLQQASNMDFLDAIELLKSNEKQYRKMEFYKISKIPLLQLYQSYYLWKKSKATLANQIMGAIEEFDLDVVVNKIIELLDRIDEDPEIMGKVEKALSNFNPESLEGLAEKLQKEIKKIKN